jgi:hypothetical protein
MISGLGAAGLNVMLGLVDAPLPGHPFVPLLQVSEKNVQGVDMVLGGDPAAWPVQMLERIEAALDGRYIPLSLQHGNVDFQLTRGEQGVSL